MSLLITYSIWQISVLQAQRVLGAKIFLNYHLLKFNEMKPQELVKRTAVCLYLDSGDGFEQCVSLQPNEQVATCATGRISRCYSEDSHYLYEAIKTSPPSTIQL